MVTSNPILDQFCLQLCIALGSKKYKNNLVEIEEAISNGPISDLDRLEVSRAISSLASRAAEMLATNFIPDLTEELGLADQPKVNMRCPVFPVHHSLQNRPYHLRNRPRSSSIPSLRKI
jgi:hypothetical protein